jgi:hypothetical protein
MRGCVHLVPLWRFRLSSVRDNRATNQRWVPFISFPVSGLLQMRLCHTRLRLRQSARHLAHYKALSLRQPESDENL